MSYEECKELINALIHATELCAEIDKDFDVHEKAERLRDELAEYTSGLMAWGLQGRVKRGNNA